MAIIPQTNLFSWEDVDNLGDLRRLQLVLRAIPDEKLMRSMEAHRGRGQDKYPVRPVWNSLLAGVVFQHKSVASLRRELERNGQLRSVCGFDPVKDAEEVVPSPGAYSRFLGNLMKCQETVDEMFKDLVEALKGELGDFGRYLACDSKGIHTHARPRSRDKEAPVNPDGRRDVDADFGKKTYRGKRKDGTPWEKVVKWFGYKLHLVLDAEYELPVAYEVTRASAPDNASALRMVDDLEAAHPELISGCEALMADKAYDDTKVLDKLTERDEPILPVIPKRNDWRDGEETRSLLEGTENIVYDCQGQLYCHCRVTGQRRNMVYQGYEKARESQKWRCPAALYGLECASRERCGPSGYGRIVRVGRERDRRTFVPLPRETLKFARLYRKRTSVERVNSRLDVSYGFEEHFIRGRAKMRLRCSLALVVMLSMALGRVREKQREFVRSLVAAA